MANNFQIRTELIRKASAINLMYSESIRNGTPLVCTSSAKAMDSEIPNFCEMLYSNDCSPAKYFRRNVLNVYVLLSLKPVF